MTTVNKIKIGVAIAIGVLILVVVAIFFTKYFIGVLAGGGILGGFAAFKRLMDYKKAAEDDIRRTDGNINEINNVITDNKTTYEKYKDTIDSIDNPDSLIAESARLRKRRGK